MLATHPTLSLAQASAPGVSAGSAAQTSTAASSCLPTQAEGPAPGGFATLLKKQMDGSAEAGPETTEAASLLVFSGEAPANDGIAALVAALMSPALKSDALARAQNAPVSRELADGLALSERTIGDAREAKVVDIRAELTSPQPVSAQDYPQASPLPVATPVVSRASLPSSEGLSDDKARGKAEEVAASTMVDPALAALLAMFPPPRPATPAGISSPADSASLSRQVMNPASALPGLPAEAAEAAEADMSLSPAESDLANLLPAAENSAKAASSAPVPLFAGGSSDAGNMPHFSDVLNATQAQASIAQSLSGVSGVPEARMAAHGSAAAQSRIDTPLNHPGWDHELGDKLVWAVGRHEQKAELVITPPQLGRVEVSLQQQGDQTHAVFVAANPAVREALESALPRLREMFADAGLSLGQASVGAGSGNQNFRQSFADSENRDDSSSYSRTGTQDSGGNMLRQTEQTNWVRQGRGMVDIFA